MHSPQKVVRFGSDSESSEKMILKMTTSILLVAAIWFVQVTTTIASSVYLNVYGAELQRCSTDGTALTGYTRNGYCVEQSDDTGSHHICINLNSTSGGNFCDVTGQNNWCSSTDMPCNDNPEEMTCAIENWCVCQWAFASYLEKAGGCDQIQDIQCGAINIEAIRAYQTTYGYEEAFKCLVERCNLNPNTNYKKMYRANDHSRRAWKRFTVAGFIAAMVVTVWTLRKSRCMTASTVDEGALLKANDEVK